jgi:hypothetical protein
MLALQLALVTLSSAMPAYGYGDTGNGYPMNPTGTTDVAPVLTTTPLPSYPQPTTTVAPVITDPAYPVNPPATTTVAPLITDPVYPPATTTVAPLITDPSCTTPVPPTYASTTVAPILEPTTTPYGQASTTVAPLLTGYIGTPTDTALPYLPAETAAPIYSSSATDKSSIVAWSVALIALVSAM